MGNHIIRELREIRNNLYRAYVDVLPPFCFSVFWGELKGKGANMSHNYAFLTRFRQVDGRGGGGRPCLVSATIMLSCYDERGCEAKLPCSFYSVDKSMIDRII